MRGIGDLGLDRPGTTIVVLGAHPDDVEIGAGGTVLRLVQANPGLRVVWFIGSASPQRRSEAEEAAAAFTHPAELQLVIHDAPDGFFPDRWADLKRAVRGVAEAAPDPALVLTPHRQDRHQDHAVIGQLAWQTWRDQLIAAYEIPKFEVESATPNLYVPLDQATAERKVSLLGSHHPSQHGKPWYDAELFRGHLRLRGIEARASWAESFTAEKVLLWGSEW